MKLKLILIIVCLLSLSVNSQQKLVEFKCEVIKQEEAYTLNIFLKNMSNQSYKVLDPFYGDAVCTAHLKAHIISKYNKDDKSYLLIYKTESVIVDYSEFSNLRHVNLAPNEEVIFKCNLASYLSHGNSTIMETYMDENSKEAFGLVSNTSREKGVSFKKGVEYEMVFKIPVITVFEREISKYLGDGYIENRFVFKLE